VTHGAKVPDTFHRQHHETRAFIQYNEQNVDSFLDCFTTLPFYPGLYRPVSTACYYYLGVKIFGNRPEPFKVVSVVFVVLNAMLFFMVTRLLLPFWGALVAAALFASRRAHLDAVLVSVEMQTLLAACFSLLVLYFYVRARRERRDVFHTLSYVCLVLALLSKEASVAMVPMLFLYEWLFERERDFRPCVTHLAVAVIWAAFVLGVVRRVDSRRVITFGYSYHPGDVLRNYLLYGLDFFNLLLPPSQGVVQPFGPTVEHLANSMVARSLFAVLVAGGAAAIVLRGRISQTARVAVFGFALFVVSAAPYAILGGRVIIRYSYAGHLGIALALGAAAVAAASRIWCYARSRSGSVSTGG
jgi:hypothetical protein